jgi:hypothetical protein
MVNFMVLFLSFTLTFMSQSQVKTSPDKWIGTWKLNLLKSKFQSGPLPKNRTLVLQEISGGFKATSDLLDDIGIVHIEFTVKYDGKDVSVQGGAPGSTISATRTDAFNFATVQKTNGQVTVSTHYVVSRDGKLLTASTSGADEAGGRFTNVAVYDKQ